MEDIFFITQGKNSLVYSYTIYYFYYKRIRQGLYH